MCLSSNEKCKLYKLKYLCKIARRHLSVIHKKTVIADWFYQADRGEFYWVAGNSKTHLERTVPRIERAVLEGTQH